MKRVAIIGAGITGLHLAHLLTPHAEVIVFEKARGVGGRMATRYADLFTFDHGAQHFTARTPAFRNFLQPYIERSLVAAWNPLLVRMDADGTTTPMKWDEVHYVATPNMNSLCKALAQDLSVRLSIEVAPLVSHSVQGWSLSDHQGNPLGQFDWVISTAPYPQTARLFDAIITPGNPLPARSLLPCFALMVGMNCEWSHLWHGAYVSGSPVSWIALNNSKPNRAAAPASLVVHSNSLWATTHLEDPAEAVEAELVASLATLGVVPVGQVCYRTLHRWRYAQADNEPQPGPYVDRASRLAAAGDWTSAPRIEDAWWQAFSVYHQIVPDLS